MTDKRLALIKATTDLTTPGIKRNVNIDDVAWLKQMILKDIYKDADIIEALNNLELQEQGAAPEDYRDINIFSYLKIPDTQSTVKNFLCFDVFDLEALYNAPAFIEKNVVFRCISHQQDINTKYGIDRQDLLGMLIKDRFAWTNFMGMRLQKDYDCGKVSENGYYYREIKFKVVSPNAMVQKGSYIYGLDQNRDRYNDQ